MSRIYSRRTCWTCKQSVSASGAAWVSHQRKHVREGKLREVRHEYGGHVQIVFEDAEERRT